MRKLSILLSTALIAAASPAAFAGDRAVTVKFRAGTTSATYKDTIKGYDAVNYSLEARAGQRLFVGFTKNQNSCYFNLLSPAAGETLVNASSMSPDGLLLPEAGRYRVVVYLMRATARRGGTCTYSIDFGIRD